MGSHPYQARWQGESEMKEINLHAALWALAFLASWTFWLVYHNQVTTGYELAIKQTEKTQEAIKACLAAGYLFHAWPDRSGFMHVKCKTKDPGPIFANYKDYKRYVKEVKRAVGGR